ncbi:hypothetical protein Tco_0938448 [Tanacetum coccineum]|uniref:Uncharacterized protein n=1 Tax=Tanacetum coccineum TaxID=301880 RepID=A0ABQ5DJ26_9ASTR
MAYSSSSSNVNSKVEAQLICHQQNQLAYEQKIRFMKIDLDDKTDVLTYHKKLLAEATKEKEELKTKLEKWENSSKGLNKLLDSQLNANDKAGLGHDGAKESKVSETITSVSKVETSNSKTSNDKVEMPKIETVRMSEPIIEEWESDSEDDEIVVKPKEVTKTVKPSFEKIESVNARNETVRQAENSRKNNKSPRRNKRNWNGMMTQKLGENFEFNNKACYSSMRESGIEMVKIHTDNNVADLLTKAFDVSRFNFLVASIGKRGRDTKIPQSGGPPIKVVMRLSIRSWVKEWKGLPLMLLAFEAEQDNRTPTTLPSIQITHEAEETATMPHDSPLPGGHTPGSDEGRMQHTELMELITKLTHRIEALEKDLQQTKKTYSTALTKLVLKVKKLEKQVRSGKAKRRDRIVLLEDEDVEDIETQEKNSADTEVLLKEATPTKLIEDLGSGEKGKKEISIADVPISTAGAEVSTTSHDVSTASQKTLVLLLRRSAQRQRTRKGSIKEGSSGEQEKAMAEQGSKKDLFEAALELQKYHALQNRPYSVAEVRKNMVMYLKNQAGYKQSYFKGMKYEEIRPIFEKVWDQTHTFVPMDSEDKEKDSEKKGSRQKITGRKKRQ